MTSNIDQFNFFITIVNLLCSLPLLCTLGVIGLLSLLQLKARPRAAWCLMGAVCLWSIEPVGVNRGLDSLVSWGFLDPDFYLPLTFAALVMGSLLTLGGWVLALYPLATSEPYE